MTTTVAALVLIVVAGCSGSAPRASCVGVCPDAGGSDARDDGGAGSDTDAAAGADARGPATCLTDWPMPNPPSTGLPHPQSYDLGTPGIVRDTVTGLEWQASIEPSGYNWIDANAYCAMLALAGGGGWRVPTVVELVSIVDPTRAEPAIDTDAFPGTPAVPFWTAQTDSANTGLAWYVYFKNGGAYNGNDVTDVQQVRCVRARESMAVADVPAASCYAIANGNGTVLDTRTMLTWQQAVDAGSYSWTDAQAFCVARATDGAPWRLPSMNELMTIADVTRADPAIDAAAFPETPSDFFWSSSTAVPSVLGSPPAAWGVNFNKGSAGAAPLDFTARVRCVQP